MCSSDLAARNRPLARILWCCGSIKEAFCLAVEIAKAVRLHSIRQHPEQEVTWQVRGWPLPEHSVPSGLKTCEVEIAQPRKLDLQRLGVRQSRSDLHTRHGRQATECAGASESAFVWAPPLTR